MHKSCDIRRRLERHMPLWKEDQFDVLLQEAIHCDQVFHNSHRPSLKKHNDHVTRMFTKLMLEGNVHAVIC